MSKSPDPSRDVLTERDLALNTLNRFSKQSPDLALEVYSHCEVPAGCGGVVLRWRNPDAGVAAALLGASDGAMTVYIDGAPPPSSFVTLTPGDHILALHVRELGDSPRAFAFGAHIDRGQPASRTEPVLPLCTAADQSWRFTTTAPEGEAWRDPGFDDRDWTALAPGQLPDELESYERYRYERIEELGGALLALPAGAGDVWIRKWFHIAPPAPERGGDAP